RDCWRSALPARSTHKRHRDRWHDALAVGRFTALLTDCDGADRRPDQLDADRADRHAGDVLAVGAEGRRGRRLAIERAGVLPEIDPARADKREGDQGRPFHCRLRPRSAGRWRYGSAYRRVRLATRLHDGLWWRRRLSFSFRRLKLGRLGFLDVP